MDITALKAKIKETTDQGVGFVRDHWKDILLWGSICAGVLLLSSQPSDEENENVYNNNFDSNSNVEIDESRDDQTDIQMDTPKRFIERSIGGIDATGARLTSNEKQFLEAFSAQYDRFKGKEQTEVSSSRGWDREGKYTSYTTTKHSFGVDKMSITIDERYESDDVTRSFSSSVELKARKIINYFRGNRHLKMFDDVRDIVDLL